MYFRKKILLSIGFHFTIFSQVTVDQSLLRYDEMTVDNDFINNKNPFGSDQEYFNLLQSVSVSQMDNESLWGAAAEDRFNLIYYFDEKHKRRFFGYNTDTGDSFLKKLGNIDSP